MNFHSLYKYKQILYKFILRNILYIKQNAFASSEMTYNGHRTRKDDTT